MFFILCVLSTAIFKLTSASFWVPFFYQGNTLKGLPGHVYAGHESVQMCFRQKREPLFNKNDWNEIYIYGDSLNNGSQDLNVYEECCFDLSSLTYEELISFSVKSEFNFMICNAYLNSLPDSLKIIKMNRPLIHRIIFITEFYELFKSYYPELMNKEIPWADVVGLLIIALQVYKKVDNLHFCFIKCFIQELHDGITYSLFPPTTRIGIYCPDWSCDPANYKYCSAVLVRAVRLNLIEFTENDLFSYWHITSLSATKTSLIA